MLPGVKNPTLKAEGAWGKERWRQEKKLLKLKAKMSQGGGGLIVLSRMVRDPAKVTPTMGKWRTMLREIIL